MRTNQEQTETFFLRLRRALVEKVENNKNQLQPQIYWFLYKKYIYRCYVRCYYQAKKKVGNKNFYASDENLD